MRTVGSIMIATPTTIGAEVPLAAARSMMASFDADLLAVRCDGRIVGVISAADVDRTASHRLVAETMTRHPLIVSATADATDALRKMAARGSRFAVVVSGDRVVGLLTGR